MLIYLWTFLLCSTLRNGGSEGGAGGRPVPPYFGRIEGAVPHMLHNFLPTQIFIFRAIPDTYFGQSSVLDTRLATNV